MRPVDAMSFIRPCGFPLVSGFIAMKLVRRTRRPGRSNRIRRSRGAWSPMDSAASVSAGRRSIAPALASSIARAGEIGESDPLYCDIHQPSAHRPAGVSVNVVTLTCDPYHSSAFARIPPPATGHSPNRAFFTWRSATALRARSAWPDDAGPSLLIFAVRRRSWGSSGPSQV
jgi:hypothetical protein